MRETFENDPIIADMQSAYAPLDAAALQRVRDKLRFAAESLPVVSAEPARPSRMAAARRRPRVLLAALLLGASGIGGAAAAAAGYLPFVPDRHMGQGYTARVPYTFTQQPIPAGMVTQQQAVVEALHHTAAAPWGRLASGVTVTARFGTYTDSLFLPRQVWLVTFSGPGVNIAVNDGGPALHASRQSVNPPVAHEDIVVIDGKSGDFLTEEVFSHP